LPGFDSYHFIAMSQSWKTQIIYCLLTPLVLVSLVLSAQTDGPRTSVIELRIGSGELVNGVPDTISFVFVNTGEREVRIPPVSPCLGRHSGTLALRLEFSPAGPHGAGKGGGCAGWGDHPPGILQEAKSWKRLKSGKSLTVSYKRVELSVFEQSPGDTNFGENITHRNLPSKKSGFCKERVSTGLANR
jgi:hypothetical protein